MRTVVLTALAASLLSTGSAFAVDWKSANGKSCESVCSSPVTSGSFASSDARMNGQQFYVCRGNAGGQGARAGYNLKPNWAGACYVGFGGREHPVTSYSCLCQ